VKEILVALAIATTSIGALSADVSIDKRTVHITGEIVEGDFSKILSLAKGAERVPAIVEIESPGGDVQEAMKIGTLARDMAWHVWAKGNCESACFFVLTGGVSRGRPSSFTGIGIHRPYYDSEAFSALSLDEASEVYRALEAASLEYLRAMGVPTSLVEKMFTVPSSEVYYLSEPEWSQLAAPAAAYV
jgi:hypothetical protein